ncbi:MAG: hypothetical protein RIF32_22100 [Leptospirales bacterium]|jgi:hypothetical protein
MKLQIKAVRRALAFAVFSIMLLHFGACAGGQAGGGGQVDAAQFSKFEGDVGNIIAGANVSADQASGFQNVVDESVAWSALRNFEKYEVRAFLPYKLHEYKWDRAVLFIEFAGEGGSTRRPFHHVLEARISNNDAELRKQSQIWFSFDNFGDVTDGIGIVGQIFGTIDAIFLGGTVTDFATGGDRPSDTNNPKELKNFRPEGLTAGENGTLRLVYDGYDGLSRFGYKLIEEWRKEHGFSKLRVTHHLYAANITGTRPYNCRNKRAKTRQVNGQTEIYYVEDCDTWIDYENPPELMAKGGYVIEF